MNWLITPVIAPLNQMKTLPFLGQWNRMKLTQDFARWSSIDNTCLRTSAMISSANAKHSSLSFFGDIMLAKLALASSFHEIAINSKVKYNNDVQLGRGNGFFGSHRPPFECKWTNPSSLPPSATKSAGRVSPFAERASNETRESPRQRTGAGSQQLRPAETEQLRPLRTNIGRCLTLMVRPASRSLAEATALTASVPATALAAATTRHAGSPSLPPATLFWFSSAFVGLFRLSNTRPACSLLSNRRKIAREAPQWISGSGEPPAAGTAPPPSRSASTALPQRSTALKSLPVTSCVMNTCENARAPTGQPRLMSGSKVCENN